ncbi:MAG: peptidoglycan recognition family protein [Candidatus Moranbacteria bacterium]|nr:peptidoglycan recognition family protein [Candidatus Moranbacteria bacterium]
MPYKTKKIILPLAVFIVCFCFFGYSNYFALAKKVQKNQIATNIPTIYPRSSWSSLSDDKRSKKIWPAEIENPKVLIIHHTATSYKGSTSKQIKKIYRYHSYTRKWGDIGYNYIIGKDGAIFEGRYGGNGVIGGHTSGYNEGSIGISVIGNYQSEKISSEALDSLEKLIGWLAANNSIDISNGISFHGEKLDSAVIGHKDVASTACPGKNIYSDMTQIRTASVGFSGTYANYAYQAAGDSQVYEIKNSQRYSGSAKSSIVSISKTQLEAYSTAGSDSEAITYPSGTLVKLSANGRMGIIDNGSIRPVENSILLTGYNAKNIIGIDQAKWNGYSAGDPVSFRSGSVVKSASSYYFMENNQKRLLKLPDGQNKYLDLSSPQEATAEEMRNYPDGLQVSEISDFPAGTILTPNNKNYYYIDAGKIKRKMPRNVFQARFSRQGALKVSRKLLKLYKTSGKVSFQDGSVVKYRKKYYFIENQKKRKFQNKKLVSSMGYKNVVNAKRTEMSGIGIGADIK